MGVFYLLFYIFGGVTIALSSNRALEDLLEGEPMTSYTGFGIGAIFIIGAAILHAVTEKRRGNLETPGEGEPTSRRGVLIGLSILAVPTLIAWLQFELHVDPISMFPTITVFGALSFVYAVTSRITHTWPLRSVVRMIALAFVGIPLGLLAVGLPMSHFTHHLSTVHIMIKETDSSQPRTLVINAEEPLQPTEVVGIGEGMGGIIEALASAKTIDLAEELEAGRMKYLEDGTLVSVQPDGTTEPILGAGDLDEMFAEAEEKDDREAKAAHEARQAAFDEKIARLRAGGRLFSGPE